MSNKFSWGWKKSTKAAQEHEAFLAAMEQWLSRSNEVHRD